MVVNKENKVKVLAYCDAPVCATGFGTVSRNVIQGLLDSSRYDVTVLGINYWGNPHNFPAPIFPTGINDQHDPYGRSWAADMMRKMDYDVLFTIQDSFILEFIKDVIGDIRLRRPNIKWVDYFPVDGPPKTSWIDAMALSDYPVTYTNWGKDLCVKASPSIKDKLSVIPHGINMKDFHPVPKSENDSFRRQYFGALSDKFIVLNVNRNQQRKDIPRSMMAFKKFKELRPNSVYYLHCAVEDHGWHLIDVANSLGLKVNEDICFPTDFGPNQGYPVEIINRIFNASDVVISTTTGEGWGLAQVEAMACCKPVISPDNTACSEIVGNGRGILVRSGWDTNAFTILPHDNEVLRPLTDVNGLVEALLLVHDNPKLRMDMALEGYKWVTSSLRWDTHIVPQWLKIFDDAVSSAKCSRPTIVNATEV